MISYWNTQCRVINYKICYYNRVFFSIYIIENNFKIIRSILSSFFFLFFFALPNDPTCYFDILDFLTTWMSIANQAHTSFEQRKPPDLQRTGEWPFNAFFNPVHGIQWELIMACRQYNGLIYPYEKPGYKRLWLIIWNTVSQL